MRNVSAARTTVGIAAFLLLAACSPRADPEFQAASVVTSTTATTLPATTVPPPTAPPTTVAPPPSPLASTNAPVVVSSTGVVVPVIGKEGGGVLVGTPCGNSTVIREGTPVPAATVVLDAGHGGGEPGAVGPNGLTEKALNFAVTGYAKAALERAGVNVIVTRTADYRMTLGARSRIALALKPKAFVSVHHNAEPDGPHDGPGSETYYQVRSAESKRLSGLLYEEIVAALRQFQVAWVGDTDAGAKYRTNSSGGDYYGILRQSAGVVASLVELAFLSNGPEAELLARPDVQQVEGEAVARGLIRYLTTSDPGSGFTEPYPRTTPAGPGGGSAGCRDPAL